MLQHNVPPEVNQLLSKLHIVEPYPPGIFRLPDADAGRPFLPQIAFFPGGSGLWMDDLVTQPSKFPVGGIMIIGQDFDSETAYHNTKNLMQQGPCNPCMRNLATWGRLITILKGVGICPKDCFFTNFFMGLRKGNKATGLFPGSNDANFVRRCQEFMKIQLEKQQPRLVITLGTKVPLRLAVLSSQLSHWAKAKTFSVLDTVGSIVHNVQFQGINSICSVVALTHPSFRPSNVGRRRYQTFHGEKAEITMICEAMKQCGIYS